MPKINAWLLGPLRNGNSLPPPPRSAPLTSSRHRCSEKDKGPGRYRPSPCLVGGASRDRTDDLYDAMLRLADVELEAGSNTVMAPAEVRDAESQVWYDSH